MTVNHRVCARTLLSALFLCVAPSLSAQQPVTDSTGHFVTVMGAKIYYIDRGAGPTVVLIHGLGDQGSVWKNVIDPLAKYHRVIAVDLIGFGRSDKPLLDYRTQTFVDFFDGFLSALRIDRPSLIGNSLGGWVAALYAAERPANVDRLVLVDASGYRSDKKMDPRMAAALRLSTREDYRYLSTFTFYSSRFYPTEAFLDYALGERVRRGDGYTISKAIESMQRNDDVLDNRLGAVRAPALIVWGRGDRLIPLSTAERFKRELKGSKLVVIDKCGHVPQVECPADLNSALIQFLGAPRLPDDKH